MAVDITGPRTRRALLAGAVSSAIALAAAALGRPLAARSADGDVVHVGDDLTGTQTTRISTLTGSSIEGVSSDPQGVGVTGVATAQGEPTASVAGRTASSGRVGVYGFASASGRSVGMVGQSDSSEGFGVIGHATAASGLTFGVAGQSDSSEGGGVAGQAMAPTGDTVGVLGRSYSDAGTGTMGWSSADATGILGYTGPAPRPDALPLTGVYGHAAQDGGRGGVFRGTAAQVRLVPSTMRPASGEMGDLFLDADGDLWFCKGGPDWKQLA